MFWCTAFYVINPKYFSRSVRKHTFWQVRPKKTQISLRIRAVLSKASFCAWKNFAPLAIQNEHSEDSDQTARMRRLIWIFVGRTCPKVLTLWLIQNEHMGFCLGCIVSMVECFWVMFYNASFYVNYRKYLEPTVYTLSIGTPYLLTILVLNFRNSPFYYLLRCLKSCYMYGTALTLIRRHVLLHLICVYTIC